MWHRHFRSISRVLWRQPSSIFAMCLIATAVGLNVGVFSLLRVAIANELPYPNSHELVAFLPAGEGRSESLSVPQFEDIRGALAGRAALVGCSTDVGIARIADHPRRVVLSHVTPDFFSTFGVNPLFGRFLGPADFGTDTDSAVLSYDFARLHSAELSTLLGQTVLVNRHPYTVVGVMPREFAPPCLNDRHIESLWLPLRPWRRAGNIVLEPTSEPRLAVYGRLSPSTGLPDIRVRIQALAAAPEETGVKRPVAVKQLGEAEASSAAGGLRVLQASAGFLLVVICAHIGTLFVARVSSRIRELGIRTALGATSAAVFTMLAMEAAAWWLACSVAAMVIAYLCLPVLLAVLGHVLPLGVTPRLALPELVAGLVLTGVTILLAALVPWTAAARQDVRSLLSGAAAPVRWASGRHWHAALQMTQALMAVVALGVAAILGRSVINVISQPLGFDSKNLVIAELAPSLAALESGSYNDFNNRFGALVQDALGGQKLTFGNSMPYATGTITSTWSLEYEDGSKRSLVADQRAVDRDYFQVLNIPLKEGRHFRHAPELDVAVVTEAFVRRYGRGRNVLNSTLVLGGRRRFSVIGIVGDVRSFRWSLEGRPAVYIPLLSVPSRRLMMAVRTSDQRQVSNVVGDAARQVDPDWAVESVFNARDRVLASERSRVAYAILLGLFALMSVSVTVGGVYNFVSFASASKRGEIAIRVALGATRRQVMLHCARAAVFATFAGVVGGWFVHAWLVSTLMSNEVFVAQLHQVSVHDFRTMGVVTLAVLAVSGLAASVPAYRASDFDVAPILRRD